MDIPRRSVPKNFHYAGPFLDHAGGLRVAFPWNRLDGRPILYASLGTTRNVQPTIFRQIAEGCQDLDVQLVISLGNRSHPGLFADLRGRPLVTSFAPQRELLKLARIVITHGGSNTVFEALMEGKPMIVIPLAFDQPAVAARLARLHVAEVLPVMRLSPKKIRAAVTKLLGKASYQDAAQKIQSRIRLIRGSACAAEIIEGALDGYVLQQELQKRAKQRDSTYGPDPGNAQTASYLPC
jgi:MGT family glycosyltransferase